MSPTGIEKPYAVSGFCCPRLVPAHSTISWVEELGTAEGEAEEETSASREWFFTMPSLCAFNKKKNSPFLPSINISSRLSMSEINQ